MKQGSGKTRAALEIASHTDADLILWLAPKSAISLAVLPEIERWGAPCDVISVGWETLSQSDSTYLETLGKLDGRRVFVVADESLFIKNGDAKRTQRALELRKQCRWALVLNGTPIARDEWDLYWQMRFLSPLILGMEPNEFRSKFFVRHVRQQPFGERREWYSFYKPNADALTAMIAPYTYHADLDFGRTVTDDVETVPAGADTTYRDEKRRLIEILSGNATGTDVIAALVRMSHIAARPTIQRAANAAEGRCLVFTNWRDHADLLFNTLFDHGRHPFLITGDTKTADRETALADWRTSDEPLILTYGVGAFSLNLQDAALAVFAGLTWNFAHYEQARGRIRRLGQASDIRWKTIVSDHGVSGLMLDNLARKESLADLVKRKIDDQEWWDSAL